MEITASRAEIDFTIGEIRRGPDFSAHFVGPIWFASLAIDAVEESAAIGNKHEIIRDGGCADRMLFERITPFERGRGDISAPVRAYGFQRSLIFSPPKIAADTEVKVLIVEDEHAVDIARALTAIGGEPMHILLGGGGIGIELPKLLESSHVSF